MAERRYQIHPAIGIARVGNAIRNAGAEDQPLYFSSYKNTAKAALRARNFGVKGGADRAKFLELDPGTRSIAGGATTVEHFAIEHDLKQVKPNGQTKLKITTLRKPEPASLTEAVIGFAALSRFIIADLSEPKSVQAELQAIVPNFQSVPVVPLINRTGKEYALFPSLQRYDNVVKPTVRYCDLDDLLEKIDQQVVPLAEKKRSMMGKVDQLHS